VTFVESLQREDEPLTLQLNQLEDVLLMIFDHLDEEDLFRCEAVCSQWRKLLFSGTPWRRLFNRQISSSQQWRNVLRIFGISVEKLETVHYRSLCRAIIEELKQIGRNWRAGNFKKTCTEAGVRFCTDVTIGDDRIAIYLYTYQHMMTVSMLLFTNKTRLQRIGLEIELPGEYRTVTNTEIVVAWNVNNMEILDTEGQLVSEVPELNEDERISWNLASCCIWGDQMAVVSQTDGQEKLSLWDVSDPSKVTRLKSQYSKHDLQLELQTSMKMDDQFIAISTFQEKTTSLYFFSKKTLNLHWQQTVDGEIKGNLVYDQGVLLLCVVKQNEQSEEFGLIQKYDVTTRCIREVCISFSRDLEQVVGFNAKFMVVAESSGEGSPSQLKIYDLEAIKNSESTEDDLLVHTVAVEFHVYRMFMDETLLICADQEKTYLLDFGTFECFRNEAKSVTLSLPWRSVWRSKGVDEEPLQPVHHMDVYREVLKYFQQLTMNCRTAIKMYPIDWSEWEFGKTRRILAGDFIGYRKSESEWVFFDENMDRSCQEMNDKIHRLHISIEEAQRSTRDPLDILVVSRIKEMDYGYVDDTLFFLGKTTYVSVLDRTIQVIDFRTNQIINEVKLERDVIAWHFNCHLLVCVHNISKRAHLLSIWKVEDSSNLNHIKDVSIGKFDPHLREGFEDYGEFLQVDEMFIAVKTAGLEDDGRYWSFHLISMKTFQVERSLSCKGKYEITYSKGYLFLVDQNQARILDVESGTFLRDLRTDPYPDLHSWFRIFCLNSNYVVIAIYNYEC
jgi:F-box-like